MPLLGLLRARYMAGSCDINQSMRRALYSWVWPVTRMSTSSFRCSMASACGSPHGTTCHVGRPRTASSHRAVAPHCIRCPGDAPSLYNLG